MKKSKFPDQQIAFALQQGEAGTPGEEVCRKMGASARRPTSVGEKSTEAPSEVRKLRHLEEENARLRKLVADLVLDKEVLTEVIKKL
jgi:putative transposase